jgi:hypothetical protein
MMIVTAILPLLLIASIIAFTAFVIRPRAAKYFHGKRINWVFGGYVTLLIAATLVSFLIPEKNTFEGKTLTEQELKKELVESEKFMYMVQRGRIQDSQGAVIKEEWELPLEGKVLTVPSENSNYSFPIFVEKKEETDGVIEAAHYVSRTFIKNLDVTSEINSPSVRINEGRLLVIPPEPTNIDLAQFSNPLPFYQFSERGHSKFRDFGSSHGWDVIYLRVPSDVTVEGSVEFVNN